MNDNVYQMQRLVLELVAARRPVDEILDQLCRLVQAIVPDSIATVMRYDAPRNRLTFRNAPTAPQCVLDAFGEIEPGPRAGSCGTALFERRVVTVADTGADPRWRELRHVAEEYGIRACWSLPLFVSEGVVGGTFAISRTIPGHPDTEQRTLLELAGYLGGVVLQVERSEHELQDQSALLRSVVDCSEDPIFVKDLDGRYLVVNEAEARHRGLRPEGIVGRTDAELGQVVVREVCHAAEREVLMDGASVVHEHEATSVLDGVTRTFQIRTDPLRDADGDVVGIVGIARDISERRRVEAAMQQAQKLESLGVLAGGIAHDFNNLLVGILANASLLELDPGVERDDDLRRCASEIRTSAVRAAELTSQLLQYAGRRQPARERVSIPGLIEELRGLIASSISKRVRVTHEFDPDLPEVAADPAQLRQVLMNLLINASDACGGGDGEIRVSARMRRNAQPKSRHMVTGDGARRDWIEIEVRDDGCGMDRDTVARIFDPFYSTKKRGRGLGLAAVLGIVRGHRGCLDVISRPGVGTDFRVWLPVDEVAAPLDDAPRDEPITTRRGRVLVVDDEPAVAGVLARVLTRSGYEVARAADGVAGLHAFRDSARPFDVVVVDFTMPGLDGGQLADRIRGLAPAVPIVLTSGLAAADLRGAWADGAVDALLAKPFTATDVLHAIDAASAARAAAPVGS